MYPGASLWLLLSLLATARAAAVDHPEVSWGDWIIVDETEPGTSILLRRITPKSVFVAPTFNGCSEGYQQDSLGRCVKLVKVNKQAQWNFFLERLNSMYAPSSTSKNPQKEAGPFHISLPIGSEGSQEEAIVNKRVPPKIMDDSVNSQLVATQFPTTVPLPMMTTTTTTQESTIPEVVQSTVVDASQATTTETDSTTETKIVSTTEGFFDTGVMLGDQPISTEDFSEVENPETPKNFRENTSQLPEKPFVIIVTNEPTRTEETTTNIPTVSFTSLTTEGEREDCVSEISSTMEVTTEGTTETTSRFTTESSPRTTDYEESFSETKDITETSIRPTVKYTLAVTVRPNCDPRILLVRDDSSDCEPAETETAPDVRRATIPSTPLPASLPTLEPHSHVRFPSESFVPVRKPQSFVKFPEATHSHEERPNFWWPSWQIRQHPGIRGWPPSEERPPDFGVNKQYPPYAQQGHSWADSTTWRKRFFQRD